MSVQIAETSHVVKFALYVADQCSWMGALAGASTVESGFFASLKGGDLNAHKAIKWIRETAISRVTEIQVLFDAINFGAICYFSYRLAEELKDRYAFAILVKVGPWFAGTAIAAIVMIGTYIAFRLTEKKDSSNSNELTIDKKSNRNFVQTSKLVINAALFVFAKNRFALGIGLAASAYSHFKNSKINWLAFTRKFPITLFNQYNQRTANRLDITYNMLAVPVDKSHSNEDCPVCMDNTAEKVSFCANHVICTNCIKKIVTDKTDNLADNLKYVRQETQHFRDGRYTHSTWHYDIDMPLKNLPACPECRDAPVHNKVTGSVNDLQHGNVPGVFKTPRPPVDRQHLFERFYAAYNIVQAGFTYLQTYPELAASIFTIQKIFAVTDLLMLGTTCLYLMSRVYKKLDMTKRSTKQKRLFGVAAVTVGVAAVALSYLVVLQINAYLKSAVVLKDVLSKLKVSPDLLKNITVNWANPKVQVFLQCLYINRIMATVALSFFSKQRALNLLSAAAQVFSLGGLSSLKFIDFTQNINLPLKKIAEGGGWISGSLGFNSLKNLDLTTSYMVPASCAKNPAHLQTIMQSVYNHSTKFLDKSFWDRYWRVHYYNGVETGRTLTYNVTLQNLAPLAPCDCTLAPNLTGFSLRGLDSDYNRYPNIITN